MRRLLSAMVSGALMFVAAGSAAAQTTLASFTSGADGSDIFIPGVRVPVSGTGTYDHLTFNFYSDEPATTPTAFGTLFLLSTEYLGTPADLTTTTAGYLAQSQGIMGGVYVFDPTVTLLRGQTYYFYANATGLTTGEGGLVDGGLYGSDQATDPFHPTPSSEPNFRLAGQPVSATPEPVSLALLGTGLVGIAGATRKRKKANREA